MKSALVVGAPCPFGVAMAGGGETDCCALAVIAANAQRLSMRMKRFIRCILQQSWMRNQSNRFLGDHSAGGKLRLRRFGARPLFRRLLLLQFLHGRRGLESCECLRETDRAD